MKATVAVGAPRLRTLTTAARPRPVSVLADVVSVTPVTARHVRLVVQTPQPFVADAGQFFLLADQTGRLPMEQRALPRPMALYDLDATGTILSFLVKVVGEGTRQLAALRSQDRLRLIGPLGRGFDLDGTGPVLLLGRGVGAFSLGLVPQQARDRHREVSVVLSAADEQSLPGIDHFTRLGCAPLAVTDDRGDSGMSALRTRLLAEFADRPRPTLVISCGSARLRRLSLDLAEAWEARAQTSVEAHMACGLGYCHGCATPLPHDGEDSPLVCTDGPAFELVEAEPRPAPGGEETG
jgi:dihydroorotate dehydrogenase electron transfer subunit